MKARTMEIVRTGISAFLGMGAWNFLNQAMNAHDWNVALDRSCYEFAAIAIFGGLLISHKKWAQD